MVDVSNIFKARAEQVKQLLHNNGNGYIIPQYQREYSWGESNTNRLIDDIREGISSLREDKDALTFIGTLITARIYHDNFDSEIKVIVDGQQRITTISLIVQILHFELSKFVLPKPNGSEYFQTFQKMISRRRKELFDAIYGEWHAEPTHKHDYFPKIIREQVDNWDGNFSRAEYKSPVAKYLYCYLDDVLKEKSFDDDGTERLFKNIDDGKFKANLSNLYNEISRMASGVPFGLNAKESDFVGLPGFEDVMYSTRMRDLLLKFMPSIDDKTASNIVKEFKDVTPEMDKLIRLLAFSKYMLERVTVTTVYATEDKYAFDIFEALNTAGEPLTALETFKPVVYQVEERPSDHRSWERSNAFQVFENLQEYLEKKFKSVKAKEKESQDIVISFASLIEAKKLSSHLSSQRKYLSQTYRNLRNYEDKKSYVANLGAVINFKSDIWSNEVFDRFISSDESDHVASFCMKLIIDMKTTTIIPILTRYYSQSQSHSVQREFKQAIMACAAFLVFWRAHHGGTAGIDSEFRKIMKNHQTGLKNNKPKLSSSELKQSFLEILHKEFQVRTKDAFKEAWIQSVTQTPMYKSSKPLTKFILMVGNTDVGVDSDAPHLLENKRSNSGKNLMNIQCWNSSEYSSIEHIAPQETKPNSDWNAQIYKDESLKHTIGNLVLMPEKENASVSNSNWKIKKIYYSYFSMKDEKSLEKLIEDQPSKELTLTKKSKSLIRDGKCLPSLENISKVEEWSDNIIKERSENIASIVFDRIFEWLK